MKKFNSIIILFFAFILGATLIFESCRKGEEDPFLSLRSRDKRITGTWVLKSVDWSTVNTNTISDTSSTVITKVTDKKTFDGSNLITSTLTTIELAGVTTNSVSESENAYSVEVIINKDNTYTYTETKTESKKCSGSTSDCTPVLISQPDATKKNGAGTWYWGNSKDQKIDVWTAVPYFYGKIKGLKNKELIISGVTDEGNSNTSTGNSDTETTTGTYTYTWEKKK